MAKIAEEKRGPPVILPVFLGIAGFSLLMWLRKQSAIYGTVTDKETGAVINGIDVGCNGYPGKTGSDGKYRITVAPGTYSMTFEDPLRRYESVTI